MKNLLLIFLISVSYLLNAQDNNTVLTVQAKGKDMAPTNFCYYDDMDILFITFEDKNSAEIKGYLKSGENWEELGSWKTNKPKDGKPCIGTGGKYLFYPTIYDPKVRSVTLPVRVKTNKKSGNVRINNDKQSNYTRIDLKKSGNAKTVDNKKVECDSELSLVEIKAKDPNSFSSEKFSVKKDFHGTVFIIKN